MLASKPVKLVIFDFDGVLVDTQKAINQLEWTCLSRHGMKMTFPEFTERFSGQTAVSIIDRLRQENNIKAFQDARQFAKEIDDAVLANLSRQEIKPFSGVKDVLKKLHLKKCIASNCSLKILRLLLAASGLAPYFTPHVFSADMVERPKPDPALFLYAARSTGVRPDQCLVIEDSEAGIKAAVAAGIRAWGFLGGSHIKPETATRLMERGAEQTFSSMKDLGDCLDKENGVLAAQGNKADFLRQRKDMVKSQLEVRGIKDKRVLKAMETVPRHLFVPPEIQDRAYADSPLPIGYEQTISQPYIVALMCEAARLSPQGKVLEIGTGSGYQAAVLSLLSQEVYTVELVAPLGKSAQERLKGLGYKNAHVKTGDGYSGWPDHAPYDTILIAAAAAEVPQPLIDQLALNGRLVMPLGSGLDQQLVCLTKTATGLTKEWLGPVLFVPFRRNPPGSGDANDAA